MSPRCYGNSSIRFCSPREHGALSLALLQAHAIPVGCARKVSRTYEHPRRRRARWAQYGLPCHDPLADEHRCKLAAEELLPVGFLDDKEIAHANPLFAHAVITSDGNEARVCFGAAEKAVIDMQRPGWV